MREKEESLQRTREQKRLANIENKRKEREATVAKIKEYANNNKMVAPSTSTSTSTVVHTNLGIENGLVNTKKVNAFEQGNALQEIKELKETMLQAFEEMRDGMGKKKKKKGKVRLYRLRLLKKNESIH